MTAAPLLLLAAPLLAEAGENWPRFRGPDGAGVVAGWTFPASVKPADFAWATPLPGSGVSSPAIWGDAAFVTAADGPRRVLFRVNAGDGTVAWERNVELNPGGPPATPGLHAKNDSASATPAADGGRVYTLFSDGERLVASAHTHAGDPVWRRDLGPFASQHGHGASPVRVDAGGRELLVFSNDQEASGGVVALDAATGEDVWRTPRPAREAAYSTPYEFISAGLNGGAPALLTASGAAGLVALDAATGRRLWATGEVPSRVVASPVLAGGRAWFLCGSGGSGKLLVGADPADGRIVIEKTRGLPYVPTPVAAGGLLFLWGDRGVVAALDPATAEPVWSERVGGNFSASPVVVGDSLLNVTEEGEVVVLNASRRFGVRGRFPLGGPTSATPAVAGGRAVFRLTDRLVALPLTRTADR